jgi:hypothetical protein
MRFAGVVVALLLMSGCGLIQEHVYTCASPSGGAEIRVEEVCGFPDCRVRVVLAERWHARRVLTYRGGCGVVIFAHAAWSGNVAAVFADVAYTEPINVAYDVAGHHEVDFSRAEPWLKKAITRDYRVTPEELRESDGDVFKWATWPGHCCTRAADEFTKRHPQFTGEFRPGAK